MVTYGRIVRVVSVPGSKIRLLAVEPDGGGETDRVYAECPAGGAIEGARVVYDPQGGIGRLLSPAEV